MMGYAPQQQQQQAWAQQQAQLQQQQQQQKAYAAYAAQQAGQTAAGDNTIGQATNMVVTGCTHATVGVIARGSYTLNGENHGKRTYKRDSQVNGLDVMIYFWDERDGPGFCGWWFGPKVGGDQVWAFHPDKSAMTPPKTGWKVPYDGPVDTTFVITPSAGKAAQQPQQQEAQQQPQQQQQQQIQQAQQAQQQAQQQQGWGQQQQQNWQQQWNQKQQGQGWQQGQQQGWGQQQKWQQQQWNQGQGQGWQQQGERNQQMEEMRQKQMEEQKRRLEENRKKLEEANKKRIEEQHKKMAELKAQQEALAAKAKADKERREQELQQKREEQRASLAIRRVIQKLRMATLTNATELIQELEDVMAKEFENCFSMQEKIKEEADQATEMANTRLRQMEEIRKKNEEAKLIAEQKRREAAEKSATCIKELAALIVDAEEHVATLTKGAEPLKENNDLTSEQINAALQACEAAGQAGKEKCKECSAYATTNSKDMQAPPHQEEGEEPLPQLKVLLGKIAIVNKLIEKGMLELTQIKATSVKKAEAKDKLNAFRTIFQKYDTDNDGLLNKEDIVAYAKGDFSFDLPAAEADAMCKVLQNGKEGVPFESFLRMKLAVGVARAKARDEKRKELRREKEKEIEEKKQSLKKQAEDALTKVSEAAGKIKEMEDATKPLLGKVKGMKSQDMGPLAVEVQVVVDAAKAAVVTVKTLVEELGQDPEPEIKSFMSKDLNALRGKMRLFDPAITAGEKALSSFRGEITKKDRAELDGLQSLAVKAIRYYQRVKSASPDEVYKAFDKQDQGKILEDDFYAFFKDSYQLTDEGVEKPNELSQDDMSRLYKSMDEDDEGFLGTEAVMALIRCFMQVVKETVITTECGIRAGKAVRRLEVKEVVEVLEGPVKDDSCDLTRIRVKALKDEQEGWVTPMGTQGTQFLVEKEGGLTVKVKKETILTSTLEISGDGANKKVKEVNKKLKEGDLLTVMQWMTKDSTGMLRMQVKTKVGGHVGWATAVGSAGAVFLELI